MVWLQHQADPLWAALQAAKAIPSMKEGFKVALVPYGRSRVGVLSRRRILDIADRPSDARSP